jgi:predicted ATPase
MFAGNASESSGLSHLAVAGYRSLQQLTLPLGPLTLVCGANGSGKPTCIAPWL